MTTTSIATAVYCPMCGVLGQLVIRKVHKGYDDKYYYVNHFRNKKGKLKTRLSSHFHTKYAYTCYLGKMVIFDTYTVVYPPATAYAIARSLRHFL